MPMNTEMRSVTMHRQCGAALITALVFLTILTMLALASMGTNTLEEEMASNSQEVNRAFQTAETGLRLAFSDDAAFNTANSLDDNGTPFNPADDIYDFSGSDNTLWYPPAETEYGAYFRQKTIPARGSGWDTSMAFYHFDLVSRGDTQTGASTTLHAGAYQVGKK